MIYTDSFKAKMVQRLAAPNAISAIKLSKEVGVSQSALSRWLEVARTVVPMTKERPSDRAVQTGSTRPAAEKIRIVMAATSALEGGATRPSSRGADTKRIKELEGQIRRKDKALAETAALLVLQKKVHEIWGDGDDDTNEGNEK